MDKLGFRQWFPIGVAAFLCVATPFSVFAQSSFLWDHVKLYTVVDEYSNDPVTGAPLSEGLQPKVSVNKSVFSPGSPPVDAQIDYSHEYKLNYHAPSDYTGIPDTKRSLFYGEVDLSLAGTYDAIGIGFHKNLDEVDTMAATSFTISDLDWIGEDRRLTGLEQVLHAANSPGIDLTSDLYTFSFTDDAVTINLAELYFGSVSSRVVKFRVLSEPVPAVINPEPGTYLVLTGFLTLAYVAKRVKRTTQRDEV